MSESLPDINVGLTKPDLFEKFKIQLKKDFDNCALTSEFCNDLKANNLELIDVLLAQLDIINKKYSGKLNELLYRIDISEHQIKKLSKLNSDKTLNEIIAELIIKRELQKVVYKEFFKKHE